MAFISVNFWRKFVRVLKDDEKENQSFVPLFGNFAYIWKNACQYFF